jgi:hypothetical protein
MTAGFKFRIEQFVVYYKLKPAPVRWDDGKGLNISFVKFQNFIRQTDGTGGIVSSSTINQFNLHHSGLLFWQYNTAYSAKALTPLNEMPKFRIVIS